MEFIDSTIANEFPHALIIPTYRIDNHIVLLGLQLLGTGGFLLKESAAATIRVRHYKPQTTDSIITSSQVSPLASTAKLLVAAN